MLWRRALGVTLTKSLHYMDVSVVLVVALRSSDVHAYSIRYCHAYS